MATDAARTGTPPVDKQRSYKGHPQPEVNERLVQAKNFLADEDINRCLGFTSKLLEIKEYVKYVETETIDWDADLLNNVKVMARVHRDWIKSQNDPPPDIIYYDAPSIQPYSSRLICADTAAALQAEKEAMGVATQMREDHPPFTVSREDDHATFMKALNDDTRANPDTIDTKNNLFWVENRAYLGALNEPAMVPVWMHPRAGLPKKGIVDGEQQPWYRRPVGNTLSLQPLPDYLQHHQDEVNRLLVESSTENGDYDAAKLQSLLSLYEPPHLKALRATCSSLLVKEASNTLAPDEVALLTFVRSECDTSCREWMKNLQKSGVRIVVSPLTAIEGNLSGVFYVPEVKPLPTDVAQLKDTQDIINGHLQKDQATLPDECKDELEKLLEPFLPLVLSGLRKTMNNIFAASKRAGISFLTFSNMAEANRLRTAFVQGFEKWTDSLRASGVRLRFFRPGEMQDHQPGVFYRNLDQVNSTPSVGLEDPEETMRALEPQINNLLLKLVGNNFVSEDYDALFNLLSHVTYPDLRNKLFYVRVLKAKMQASAGDLIAYGTLSQEYNSLWPDVLAEYDEWVDSFKHSVVVLRMPQEGHVDERPGVAYDRQDPAHDNPGVILALQAQLNDSLEKREDQRKQAENRWLTQSLQSLFYPRLKLIWDKVESLRTLGVLNQGESGLKDQLESDFSDLYDPWLKSLKYFGIKIRRSSFNGDPLEGDPTLLYYRGPPDPPDMTDPLSPPEIAAMLRQRKDDGLLENIEIVTVMQNYLPKNIRANLVLFQNMTLTWRNTSIWMSRRRALVGEFLEWAAKQQQLASLPEFPAPSISPQDSNLPPESQLPQYLQEQESLIQTLLQDLNPGLEGNQTLDEVLYDYWQPHLLRLQELRKHQLRSEGRSEAEIAGISMTDGYFRNQFESFKTMCRAYGFKIVEGPPGVFSAQDPNRPLSTTIKRLSRNSSRRDYSGRQYTRNGPGNGATGNGTSGNGSSGWNANTGENSTSGHQEPGHNDGLEPLPIQIQKIEDEINEFLRQSRVRSLSFYEHDKLSKLLQCVMYPSLVELTESIRELDEKARDRLLPGLEPLEFYTLWQRWYGEFEAWTRTFPEPGITIRIPEPGQEPSQDSGVLYLQVWNPWDLPPVSRAQDLPRHVQKVEDKLNRYLNPIRALAEEEEKELNVMMRPIWRPIGVAFRQQIINDMQRQEPGKENTPEGSAILEERLSSYYQAWKDQQRHCAVKICESQRGNFSTKLVQTPETLDLVEDPNLAQIIPQGIIDAEAEIWPLAKLATNMDPSALTNAQCATLSSLLEPISLARVARLKDLVSTLINKFRAKGELTAQEHRKLKEHFSDLVWQRYGYSHPSLREKFLLRLCYPDPTELLSWSGLPASEPLPKPLPILVPPTPSEIQTLEDLINDLLRRYRDNTLVGREGVKLDYLLRPLLPENLQSIRLRIKYYERKLLESQGLDTNESLLLAECTRQFDIEHQKWKDSLPNLFVRLDTLWQPQSVVKEIFARTAFLDDILSRQVNTTLDRGISTPSRVAEMEAWRETDRILRDYVRDIHNLRAEQPEELLLLSVPTSVARLYDAIGTISPDPTVGGIDTAAQLDRTRQQFIREYMDWYMSLSRTDIQNCSNSNKGRTARLFNVHRGPTDFTPKAKRRGIQRGAIELALNQLATNQEQHLPYDRFRIVNLRSRSGGGRTSGPGTTGGGPRGSPTPLEVPLWLPLEPWKRPLEQDTFKFMRNIVLYRQWKDFDYQVARDRSITQRRGKLQAPVNYLGPSTLPTGEDAKAVAERRKAYLAQIFSCLAIAENKAPRPLIEQLLLRIREALALPEGGRHPLLDEVELTQHHLGILQELSAPSWNEIQTEYAKLDPQSDQDAQQNRAHLIQFEYELHQILPDRDMSIMDNLPWWEPAAAPASSPNANDIFQQIQYNGSTSRTGLNLAGLSLKINSPRRRVGAPLYTTKELTTLLTAMHEERQIHFDADPRGPVAKGNRSTISRIPFSGHPENKYVVSRADAHLSPGVRRNAVTGSLEVQYDAQGTIGLPIVQPNKYEFLPLLAFRLGRNIDRLMRTLSQEDTTDQARLRELREGEAIALRLTNQITPADRTQQSQGPTITVSPEANSITLQRIAQDLDKVAPELADDAGFPDDWYPLTMTEDQAATLIQMQILEELNNNWESRFPENEHVWEFATPRVTPIAITHTPEGKLLGGSQPLVINPKVKNFFSMRRWSVACQSEETQRAIVASGPEIQEKPKAIVPAQLAGPRTSDDVKRDTKPVRERHIRGQRPYFLFGETPYQQAYLSWRMEQDLKDVPEFQAPLVRRSLLNPLGKRKPTAWPSVNRFALPKLPENWTPSNISQSDKLLLITEAVRNNPAFPSEYEEYYTQEEIANIKRKAGTDAVASARVALEKGRGLFDNWTDVQKNEFYRAHGIDGMTGRFLVDPATRNIDPVTGLLI